MMLLSIIISALVFNFSKNHTIRQLCLIISSLIVYWHFVGNGIFPACLLILVTIACKSLINNKVFKFGHVIGAYVLSVAFVYVCGRMHNYIEISLPIGFSIIMFSGISLMVDERKYGVRYSILDSMAFLVFFPKILAGPIERMKSFSDQAQYQKNEDRCDNLYLGFKIVVFGAFIKYVCSDFLEAYVESYHTGVNQLISIFLFAIQFYLDFWAYSLLAIGIAKVYGVNLMFNFNKPYRSTSFKDFWKRWNISLSSWLKDYIYVPLLSYWHTYKWVCVIIVFVISALWHGITLPFIIWGMVHAACVILEKSKVVATIARTRVYSIVVVCVVSMLWQTFRFHDLNSLYLEYSRLFVPCDVDVELISVFVVSILVMLAAESKKIERLIMSVTNFTLKEKVLEVSLLSMFILSLLFLCTNVSSQFFYFKY